MIIGQVIGYALPEEWRAACDNADAARKEQLQNAQRPVGDAIAAIDAMWREYRRRDDDIEAFRRLPDVMEAKAHLDHLVGILDGQARAIWAETPIPHYTGPMQ